MVQARTLAETAGDPPAVVLDIDPPSSMSMLGVPLLAERAQLHDVCGSPARAGDRPDDVERGARLFVRVSPADRSPSWKTALRALRVVQDGSGWNRWNTRVITAASVQSPISPLCHSPKRSCTRGAAGRRCFDEGEGRSIARKRAAQVIVDDHDVVPASASRWPSAIRGSRRRPSMRILMRGVSWRRLDYLATASTADSEPRRAFLRRAATLRDCGTRYIARNRNVPPTEPSRERARPSQGDALQKSVRSAAAITRPFEYRIQ